MSSASQGPGWWQASDGNWYPPQEAAGYSAPPVPSAPPPPGAPQYPAQPGYSGAGTPAFDAQAAFSNVVSKVPMAGWLLFGGFVVAQISLFLPWFSANVGDLISFSASMWKVEGGVAGLFFLLLAGGAVVSLLLFTRPQNYRLLLIGLSGLVGLLSLHLIYNWLTMDSQLKEGTGDASGIDVSPQFGIFLYTFAIAFLAARIVMMWMAQSKQRPQLPPPAY